MDGLIEIAMGGISGACGSRGEGIHVGGCCGACGSL